MDLPLCDTPMLRDTFRSLRSEAMNFMGEGREQQFNKLVEQELLFCDMEPKPANWVSAAERVLSNLSLLDAEAERHPDAFDFYTE